MAVPVSDIGVEGSSSIRRRFLIASSSLGVDELGKEQIKRKSGHKLSRIYQT